MRRLGLLALLLGLGTLLACEDDSDYSIGPPTFSNDVLDGSAGAGANADAAADAAAGGTSGAAGTSGTAGTSGAAGKSGAAGTSGAAGHLGRGRQDRCRRNLGRGR